MNALTPGWKGQSDGTEREPTPCVECGGKGYLEGQSYDDAVVPDNFIAVQRCDACQMYEGDDDAADAFAADYGEGVTVHWFQGPGDDPDPDIENDTPGDYAIGPIGGT